MTLQCTLLYAHTLKARSFKKDLLSLEQWQKMWDMNFIAGRPKAALLFWFFCDFRCGALLFMVIHVIYKYKNR